MPETSDERYRLVYETAKSAVERQEATLDELRTRVGTTLASAVISTAFFGSLGIKGGHLGRLQWAGLILFVVVALLQGFLLVPLKGWRFRFSPKIILEGYVEADPPKSADDIYKELAVYIDTNITGNGGRLKWMWWVFTASVVVLAGEVVVWLLATGYR